MSKLVVSMFFLLTAVVCLTRADSYSQLDPRLKKFVDLTIVKANQQFNHFGHLNFFEFGTVKEVSQRVKMDVRLKNTNCRKVSDASGYRHRPECPFKQLQVWCVVCSPDPDTNEPFIGCVRKADAKMSRKIKEGMDTDVILGSMAIRHDTLGGGSGTGGSVNNISVYELRLGQLMNKK